MYEPAGLGGATALCVADATAVRVADAAAVCVAGATALALPKQYVLQMQARLLE